MFARIYLTSITVEGGEERRENREEEEWEKKRKTGQKKQGQDLTIVGEKCI